MNKFFAITAAIIVSTSISVSAATADNPGKSADKVKAGHYDGKSNAGNAISFDVVRNGSKTRVENLSADVKTECWADSDQDGVSDTLVAHVSNLSGKITRAGELDVFYAPDEDTEYVVQGSIVDGLAKLNVIVGGNWDAAGMPNTAGPFACDNWGTRYKAERGSSRG